MQNLIPFHSINWGEDEAKKDANLFRYFVPPPQMSDIESGKIRFIIGRKGTGKTAIFQYLRQKNADLPTSFYKNVSLRNFPLGLLRSLEDKRMTEKAKYVPVWRYALLMEVCAMIKEDNSLDALPIQHQINEFISRNFGNDFNIISSLTMLKERGFKLSFSGSSGIGIEFNGKQVNTMSGELHYQKVCDELERIVKSSVSQSSYYLFIDELDEGFRASDSNVRLIILSLLRAVDDLAEAFKDTPLRIMPMAALRSDIWNGLNDNDLNKYDENLIRLRWDSSEDQGPNTLRTIVNSRITASLGLPDSEKDWWPIFAQDTDPNIPGRKSLWRYMSSRTFDRPRDILKFIKICSLNAKPDRLVYRDVEKWEKRYSDWLYDELKNEAGAHIPVWKELLDCITKVGSIFVDDPERILREIRADAKILEWMQNSKTSEIQLLEELFEFGVIGNIKSNDYFIFRHKNEDTRFNIRDKIVIQFGLIKKLSLRS